MKQANSNLKNNWIARFLLLGYYARVQGFRVLIDKFIEACDTKVHIMYIPSICLLIFFVLISPFWMHILECGLWFAFKNRIHWPLYYTQTLTLQVQLINLGAGFDTLFWRLQLENKPLNNFIEVKNIFDASLNGFSFLNWLFFSLLVFEDIYDVPDNGDILLI